MKLSQLVILAIVLVGISERAVAAQRSQEQVVAIRSDAENSLRELYTAAGIVVPGDSLNMVEEEQLEQLKANPGTNVNAVEHLADLIRKSTDLVRLLTRIRYRLEPEWMLAEHRDRAAAIDAELDALGV